MLTTKQSKSAKVLLCGMKNVGKTCLIEQLIYGNVTLETVNIPYKIFTKIIKFVDFLEILPNHRRYLHRQC